MSFISRWFCYRFRWFFGNAEALSSHCRNSNSLIFLEGWNSKTEFNLVKKFRTVPNEYATFVWLLYEHNWYVFEILDIVMLLIMNLKRRSEEFILNCFYVYFEILFLIKFSSLFYCLLKLVSKYVFIFIIIICKRGIWHSCIT